MRSMEFEACLDDVPKYFAVDDDIVMSHVFTVLSSIFPDGERFFVRSVEAVLDRIDDPGLRRAADGFVGQETMHGREHQVLNERLAELGYPTRIIGAYVRNLNRLRERYQSERANLAVTAALEHYTATLAAMILSDGEARAEVGHEGVRGLLVWHALEEAEHKAVAFDVYQGVGGTERMRVTVMWVTHVMFVLELVIWTAISLAMDAGARRDPRRVLRSLWRLRHTPLVSRHALRRLSRYHRRGFHPSDHDDSRIIAEWRTLLFGPEGRLNGLVADER
jgi:hypothetical protein